ncbi:uncharacterized protein LOC111790540 isoform X2 [Cucurbita pepo subsp. pepo]|uniref:uncharacterized protein LOC111790540 isoform X2 n=1 Tax=Cucurbita pepo subsp. pepo TaxID=3664 RepID=UPI000C9D7B07|nr:uncharacterized protein LOC111790540 isoform X2 [Cucurbita pepo subsp. pepo]
MPKIFPILLLLFIIFGFGVGAMEAAAHAGCDISSSQKSGGKPRKVMMEVMDYADPGPNTNTRSGYLTPPSSPPPPPSS